MFRMVVRGVVAWLLLGGAVMAQSASDLFPGSDPSARNSVKLTTVLMALPAGTPWLSMRMNILCDEEDTVRTASGSREPQDLPPYAAAFKTELEGAGYKIVSSEEDLFERDVASADFQVAAVISHARVVACVSAGRLFSGGTWAMPGAKDR